MLLSNTSSRLGTLGAGIFASFLIAACGDAPWTTATGGTGNAGATGGAGIGGGPGGATSGTSGLPPASIPTLTTLPASADGYVRAGCYSHINYASEPVLWADGNPDGTDRRSYVQFDVSSLPVGTTNVQLILRVVDPGAAGDLYLVPSFTENSLTYDNRPLYQNGKFLSSGPTMTTMGADVRFDVTSTVTSPGTYTFLLMTSAMDGTAYSSREGIAPPRLEIAANGINPGGGSGSAGGSLGAFPNANGQGQTTSTFGIDPTNPFFQTSLGANGRACTSCHQADQGWSITPDRIQQRFAQSQGLDPLFRPRDGAVSPYVDVSTEPARRNAYALLLNKGLLRTGLPVPPGAEFAVIGVQDPYGYANASDLSLFRRPLPTTNLGFLAEVMWDGRETGFTVRAAFENQASSAAQTHLQANAPLSQAQRQSITNLTTSLFTAQSYDNSVGDLTRDGATGGPLALSKNTFYVGMNNPFGADPQGRQFDRSAMHVFDAWTQSRGFNPGSTGYTAQRAAIGRGQQLFSERRFTISGVNGLNDDLGTSNLQGTCLTCHNTPNVGTRSIAGTQDIGVADAMRATPDLPIYTVRCNSTGTVTRTTDPGRALVTGRCRDIGKFRVPGLRGLSTHAPYFHNGSARTIGDVVEYYNQRFFMNLSQNDKVDLVAFLGAL